MLQLARATSMPTSRTSRTSPPSPSRVPLEVKVGPPQLAIHQGHTLLVCEPDGQIVWRSRAGIYFRDTRVISDWMLYANGEPWDLLSSGTTAAFRMRCYLVNRQFASAQGTVGARTLGLTLSRHV